MRILVSLIIIFISTLCATTINALSFKNIQLGSTSNQIVNRLHGIGFDKTESDDIEGPYVGYYLNYKAKMYLSFKNNKIERIKIRIGEYEDENKKNDYNFTPQEAAPILIKICNDIQNQSNPLSIVEDENKLFGGYVIHYDDGIVTVAMDKAVTCKKGVIWISFYYPFLF